MLYLLYFNFCSAESDRLLHKTFELTVVLEVTNQWNAQGSVNQFSGVCRLDSMVRVTVSPLLLLFVFLSVRAIDDSMLLMLFWILTGLSVLGLFSQRYGLQPLTIALIIRSIYHLGLCNTLILLGSLNVCHTVLPIHRSWVILSQGIGFIL